jgi:lycopene cyclase domain-containing protein
VTYTLAVAIGVVTALVLDIGVARTRLVLRKAFWTTYAIMLAFQLVVNGVLTGLPVVRYRRSAILGPRLAYAPVEDLLFGFCLALLTLTIWVWLGRRASAAAKAPRPATTARRAMPTDARRENTS